jgi:thiosulfate/3-mercaptopyruvate sulfurtransferase
MNFTTLISAEQLRRALRAENPPVVLDTSFDLTDTDAGERAWREGHVPDSHYLHLDRDLSGTKTGRNGRHPLPAREDFAITVGALGITPDTQVVVLDRQQGAMAARAWWMLGWLGHSAVAVLDGGWQAWISASGEVDRRRTTVPGGPAYPLGEPLRATIDAAPLAAALDRLCLLDARAPERYRGEVEPLDAQAGHIPGALNRFFKDNLQPDGRFKTPAQLRAEFEPLVAGRRAEDVVHQCGSGVTACHNLLAMEAAGLGRAVLYPGSWSEWSADPSRPVARG